LNCTIFQTKFIKMEDRFAPVGLIFARVIVFTSSKTAAKATNLSTS